MHINTTDLLGEMERGIGKRKSKTGEELGKRQTRKASRTKFSV